MLIVPKSIRLSYVGGDGHPTIQWGEFAHKFITQIALQLADIPNDPVGKERTVRAPWDQNFLWTTQLHEGETVWDILENHSIDPDLFAIDVKKQEEHGVFPITHTGLAPYMAQRFLNDAINATSPDLKWLYLAWALHYLQDCGMPYHTSLDLAIQTTHFAVESYVDGNLATYEPAMSAEEVQNMSSLFNPAWKLAETVNPMAPLLYQAWKKGDNALVDDIAQEALVDTTGYVAGAIRNINDLYLSVSKPASIIEAGAILIPGVVLLGAAAKRGKPHG